MAFPAGMRRTAIEGTPAREFAPPPALLTRILDDPSPSPALAALQALARDPPRANDHLGALRRALSAADSEAESIAPLVLLCALYSARNTRRTLLQCAALCPQPALSDALATHLAGVSVVRISLCHILMRSSRRLPPSMRLP
jgi:hypothetical protein